MAVDPQDINTRIVDRCQSENIESSSSTGYRRWSGDAAQTPASRARLIAAAAPSSGAFLQAIPMSSVGTRLDNTSMRIAVSIHLYVWVRHWARRITVFV